MIETHFYRLYSMMTVWLSVNRIPPRFAFLTFISMINTTFERLKARNLFIFRYVNFYELLKFRAQLSFRA